MRKRVPIKTDPWQHWLSRYRSWLMKYKLLFIVFKFEEINEKYRKGQKIDNLEKQKLWAQVHKLRLVLLSC